ncbi:MULTISPECIES: hypothetical protein [unclassified Streptomyces]|uniref:hypothetical protein n=1 Tax=unclassified Streptomyces TaxID=2593676 RepID=UPI00093C1100|nr:hypothetical protein [Streptomyces sp. TSRI0281]OKI47782.1 hypothetical protein A6A29_01480 [Streptomyces sp. TSRI0281]
MATGLARRAVELTAPHELAQFPLTADAFHRAPAQARQWPVNRREPLAIGLEAVAMVISTAALAAAVQVLDHLAQQASAHVVDTTRNRLVPRLLRRRTRRDAEPSEGPARVERLTAEQLAQLREVAARAAIRWRVPEQEALAIADGIVAELATLSQEEPGGGAPGRSGRSGSDPGDGDPVDGDPRGIGPGGCDPADGDPRGNGPGGCDPVDGDPRGNGPRGNGPRGNGPRGIGPGGCDPADGDPRGNGPRGSAPGGCDPADSDPADRDPAGSAPGGSDPGGDGSAEAAR